jgi:hypothetical protein
MPARCRRAFLCFQLSFYKKFADSATMIAGYDEKNNHGQKSKVRTTLGFSRRMGSLNDRPVLGGQAFRWAGGPAR